jgi:hypothetical protein
MLICEGWAQGGRQGEKIGGPILWVPAMRDAQSVGCSEGQGISSAAGA